MIKHERGRLIRLLSNLWMSIHWGERDDPLWYLETQEEDGYHLKYVIPLGIMITDGVDTDGWTARHLGILLGPLMINFIWVIEEGSDD